jgi:glycosyltransferase involved in cell wall biosynthesis
MTNTKLVTHPKISIITVVRNGMPYVEQTIESVLNQGYNDMEYIVIDGGSTDGTIEAIKSYESRISKWISERDEGIADAFNKGLSFATGDYLLFLNSDDALANQNVLKEIAEKIVLNEFPPLIYGDYNILGRDSGEIMYHGTVKLTRKGLLHGQVLPHPCLFTKRSYFEKYGGFDPQFRIAMDYEWLLRGGLVERIEHVPLLVSNIRDGGISTLNHEKVVDEIVSALKKNQFIRSVAGEYKMRGYFFIRSFLRKALSYFGLYNLFFKMRNRLTKWGN